MINALRSGIYAKPIIDILITAKHLDQVDLLNSQFEALDYTCAGENGIPGRRFYWKGSSEVHTFHIHLFEETNMEILRHVNFRNYLTTQLNYAQAYSWIKHCLAEQFSNDIESYVNGKESFIRMIDYRAGSAKTDQIQAEDNVILVPYNPKWEKLAQAEIEAIKKIVPLPFRHIEHLGSTAVPDMSAKPVLDIFIAVDSVDQIKAWIKPLEAMGYLFWHENPDETHGRFFKGMPPYGMARTHHVHILVWGDDYKRRVLFRDLLRVDAKLCRRYQKLKQDLAQKYADDREAYTAAKGKFIKKTLSKHAQ